jgi:hypothetical protein
LPEFENNPGQNVSIEVSSSPNSTVSLVAVDEHLLNFGYGNAITYDYIFLEELSKYNHIPFEEHFELDGLLWFPFDSYERKFFVSISMEISFQRNIIFYIF